MRQNWYELDMIHNEMKEESDGINHMFPDLTVLPRNCALPGACPNVENALEIGYTRSLAELPMNTAIEVCRSRLLLCLVLASAGSPTTPSVIVHYPSLPSPPGCVVHSQRILDVSASFIEQIVTPSTRSQLWTDPSSTVYKSWKLLTALSLDLRDRLNEIEAAYIVHLLDEVDRYNGLVRHARLPLSWPRPG
jgi:hypothetical protein